MVSVPSPVSIGSLGLLSVKPSSSAGVNSLPPISTVSIPASALMVIIPVIGVVLPSSTLLSAAVALPSVSSTIITGAPSVCPSMVMVNVVSAVLPSASVRV